MLIKVMCLKQRSGASTPLAGATLCHVSLWGGAESLGLFEGLCPRVCLHTCGLVDNSLQLMR